MEFSQEELQNIVKSIPMIRVFSTNVGALGYDKDKKILRVLFRNNTSYLYFDVEEEIWNILKESESKGKTLNECVIKNKEKYKYIKLK